MKIWQIYVFGRLDTAGDIEYYAGGTLVVTITNAKGKKITYRYANPTEAQMNAAGWYRVVNVAEEGEDAIIDNILYHYTGAPIDEPIDEEEPTED